MTQKQQSTLLAIDVGTSSIKVVATDQTGHVLASSLAPTSYFTPDDASELTREFVPDELWALILHLINQTLHFVNITDNPVAAIGITSQRQGVGFLDKSGNPLYLGPNLDLRAVFEGAALDDEFSDTVYATTGHLPSFFFAPAKLRWFQANRPDVYDLIATVFTLADWVAYRLTGELVAQETLAAEAGLLEIASEGWATSLLELLGLRTDWFPPLTKPGTTIGGVTKPVSEAIGVQPGTPVVVAGPDTQCGLLAMGVVQPGAVGVLAGWSVTAQAITAAPQPDAAKRTWVGRHVVPDRWIAEANAGDGGNAYRWLRDLVFGTADDAYQAMEGMANNIEPGSDGLLALLGPAPLDLSRPGLRPGGFIFPVPTTFSDYGQGHLARGAMENIAYATRGACELLKEVTGVPANSISLGGGMIQTALFNQILADVLGRPINVASTPHASAVGAALIAGASLTGADLAAMAAIAHEGKTIDPKPGITDEYEDHYGRWLEAQERLQGFL
jgi:sugar (pentulose or hexulose) kinase